MLPDGKLYVRGAEETVPAMQQLVEAARAAGIVHVASADDHELTDAEISDDARLPQSRYPPHCLRGTRGARKIPETEQEDPVPITLELAARHYLEGSRVPAPEEELRCFHEPEHGPAARPARPRRDRRLRRRDRHLRRRGDPRFPRTWARRCGSSRTPHEALNDGGSSRCTPSWREQGVEFTTVSGVLGTFALR